MNFKDIGEIIAEYFKTQPILKAWIFGSFARGEETPLSDVDILVHYEKGGVSLFKHAAIICDLERLLDRSVDLVQEKLLKPEMRESVNLDKRLVYERIS